MKKLLLALLVAAPLAATAAPGPDGDKFQQHYLKHLEKRLDLSDAQKQQINQIFTEHRQQMEGLRESTQSKVDAVLTEEQRAEMAKLRDERKEKWQERKEEHKGKMRDK